MAYGDDIDALNPSHRYILSADANDSTGSANGTNTGGVFTGSQICEDTTNSYVTNGTGDRISLPTTSTINNAAQTRKAVCGWFMATSIQTPPKRIYGEGNNSTTFQFVMAYGNNSMLEIVEPTNFTIQIYGVVFQPNRVYHLCGIFEGNGFGNEARYYVDGVEQTLAEPTNRQPDTADLNSRGVGEFGDPAGTVGVGGDVVVLNAPVNGQYAQWAIWDGADAVLTDIEVREELFEKGALPEVTISSGTEVVMQTSLDAEADTVGIDSPLDIRINQVTGDGDLTLSLDNRIFNPLSSIHIQYMGTGTLTIRNTNGSNASIGSTPNGGTIEFVTPVNVQVTCRDAADNSVIEDARVYVVDGSQNVIVNGLTNVSGVVSATYDYSSDLAVTGVTRKGSASPYYKQGVIGATITENGLNITILMIKDE